MLAVENSESRGRLGPSGVATVLQPRAPGITVPPAARPPDRVSGAGMGAADGVVRLGAYAARGCAVRVQWDVVQPCEPAQDTVFQAELARRGLAFEDEVFRTVRELHPDAAVIDAGLTREERERATREAIDAGARIIVAPRLAHDAETGRVGEPDLLVRRGSGYLPVDVKHHRTLARDAPDDLRGTTGLEGLGRGGVVTRPLDAGTHDAHRVDLLQLAHYWRMLERIGRAASGAPAGAIVGREGLAVWFDLSEPRIGEGGRGAQRGSALDIYDIEYAERHRVAAASLAHLADPVRPLPLVPVSITECPDCRWREHCGEYLAAREDVSLLPRVTRPAWEALSRVGADTIPRLAAMPDGLAVEDMTEAALASAVAHARARVGPEVAYRRPGVASVRMERADVELDVDMENVEEGAYLWGVHVTDRSGSGVLRCGYHHFVDWDPDAAAAGARAFAAFWSWLDDVRRRCDARGLTLRAYCWSAAAENRWLREGARSIGRVDEVERFIDSEQWVDLMRVFDTQVITGRASGLKVVAQLLGFSWADEDPSGAASMVWWQEAMDAARTDDGREQVRSRILAYNADDVRATLHVRDWLERTGPTLSALPTP
jgi:predicted RecB family nuclease